MDDLSLRRFMALFRGNQRSYGQWDPTKPKEKQSYTVKGEYTEAEFTSHLEGRANGVGIVPIRDDANCFWGAIDVDNHGSDKDIDIRGVEKKVADKGLPLVACRSKSGGVHLYMFCNEPVKAEMMRNLLQRWAREIGIEGVDCIYPKQSRLMVNSEGNRALGNWINLPYYGADDTARFAVSNGKRLSLEGFLSLAEGKAVDQATLVKLFGSDHSQMPPCLQARMRTGGFAPGERNDGVYQVAVYCRKRDPESMKEAAHDLSLQFMPDNPLAFRERDKTIRSASGRSYNYKCDSFKDVCDREACRKLKYGISESEYDALNSRAAMPVFSNMVKYHNCDPVRFDVQMGQDDNSRMLRGLTIEQLSNFPDFRKIVMEQTHVVMPRLKADEWDKILNDLFSNVSIEEIPEDSTPEGAVRMRLHEFVRKADLRSAGDDVKDRDGVLRGVPVVTLVNDRRCVIFRSIDFVGYLTKTKTDAIKNKDLWFKVNRVMGVEQTRIRVGKQVVSVWVLPVDNIEEEKQEIKNFEPEY